MNSYICIIYFQKGGCRDCGGVSTPGHGQGEGSAGDKFRVSGTQETVEGAGANEVSGVLRNPYHPPGVTNI